MKFSVTKVDTFQNAAAFKQSPFTQENYLQVEERLKNKSFRIITERKNGYVRKYLVKANGTKILIAEMRVNEEIQSSEKPSQFSSTASSNAKEMLDHLNASSALKSIRLKD
ncbi:hypothetical protein [Rummeliibacillus suwonensis]|jgi:hypothetical protein|uniref:hypothetical protein n=1 Tax=Rummeliibacillus suwonensis TaxID=1306154 RepID=UPI001AAE4A1E|nr:hypothetical protein [Rummeliibacillus suwonensis]MBO2536741.1 hypothetical protein [Rummeliibacillus suwonensis]